MKPVDLFYSVTSGPQRRRTLLTPVGALVFIALLALPVFVGPPTDHVLGLPRLLPGAVGWALGASLLAVGGFLWAWCIVLFWRAKGTPVPFNPPRDLVVVGPYASVRNPMLTGVCACLFGLGFVLHSLSMVLVWTPLFVAVNVISLKVVEEPELERRFGPAYTAYRERVPMFIPAMGGRGPRRASSN